MKIDFLVKLFDLDGKPIYTIAPDPEKQIEGEQTTLRKVAVDVLLAQFNDEATLAAEEKVSRFTLAQRISGSNPADLTLDEIGKIKKLVAKGFPIVVVGTFYGAIDGQISTKAS